jgi:ribosomal protein S18 acetylase RimI-like enzyme
MKAVLSIRRMISDDLEFALHLVKVEGWDDSRDELARLLTYEPEGCFIAEVSGKSVGMVTTTSYGKLGWIGCLIVEPERRRRGIGTELMQRAIEHLRRKGVETIRLDAVQKAVPLYRRLGFVEECRSLRFRGAGSRYDAPDVVPMEPSHLKDVFELDVYCFGADRPRVLRQVFQDFPELCFISYAEGELAGFIMARRLARGARIGPWICRPERLSRGRAEPLLRAALNALGDQLVNVGVVEDNRASQEILRRYGFREGPWSVRMRLGPDRYSGDPQGIFAIGAAAKG